MRRAGAFLLAVVLVAACEGDPAPARSTAPASASGPAPVSWHAAALPAEGGSAMLRDAVQCPDGFFVVGAIRDARGGTRPAAWTSPDGAAWTALSFAATSYYGKQNILYAAACGGGRLAALGAKVGGAHGNPRTSSWVGSPQGPLREVTAPFELFGGPRALNVARLQAGQPGFLIAGNRMSGAAAWTSRDASKFEIHEGAPGLASGADGVSWAFDGLGGGDGWLLLGGWLPAGRTDRDAAGWTSADGSSWRRLPAAGATEAYEELHRGVLLDDVPVAVGVSGATFGAWRLAGGSWQPAGSFGTVHPGGGSAARSLTVAGSTLWAVTTDGSAYATWRSTDAGAGWHPVPLPGPMPPGAETSVVLASGDARVVLITDDGIGARIYWTETGA